MLESLSLRDFAVSERIQSGKEMWVRMVALLTRLVVRFDPDRCRMRSVCLRAVTQPHLDPSPGKKVYRRFRSKMLIMIRN